jgi:hypothetical protein
VNPYTCRLLIRIDGLRLKLLGRELEWRGGYLCQKNGVSWGEIRTVFPDWMFIAAVNIQNRWVWTRKVLSA